MYLLNNPINSSKNIVQNNTHKQNDDFVMFTVNDFEAI